MRKLEDSSRQTRGKRAKKKPTTPIPPWAIAVAVVCGLLMFVGLGLTTWLLFRSGRTSADGAFDDGEQALDVSRKPVSIRKTRAAVGLDISAPAQPSPDKWTVTPDTVKPAEGVRSVFAWPEADPFVRPHALLLTPPDVARAAATFPAPRWRVANSPVRPPGCVMT
jgi:hypothetical protein